MEINVDKVRAEILDIEDKINALAVRTTTLDEKHKKLVEFLAMIETYKVNEVWEDERQARQVLSSAVKKPITRRTIPGSAVNKATLKRTLIAQAIIGAFQAGELLTAKNVVERVGVLFPLPTKACSPSHHISPMLTHEMRDRDGILEPAGTGQYRLKDNAAEIITARVAGGVEVQTH